MPKSLAELRAQKPDALAERAYTLCLAPHLVAEVQMLTEELSELPDPTIEGHDGERVAAPRRLGEGPNPRAVEIRERLTVLLDEMAEYEGELRLRAKKTDGEWRQWVNEHPARGEDEPGHRRDLEVTFGYCNADALMDDLETYAHAWNGEPLAEGDWAMLKVGNADKKKLATLVAVMYESDLSLPKWRSGLSASLRTERASALPDSLGSVSDGSSAGSPPSDTSTSTQTGT